MKSIISLSTTSFFSFLFSVPLFSLWISYFSHHMLPYFCLIYIRHVLVSHGCCNKFQNALLFFFFFIVLCPSVLKSCLMQYRCSINICQMNKFVLSSFLWWHMHLSRNHDWPITKHTALKTVSSLSLKGLMWTLDDQPREKLL